MTKALQQSLSALLVAWGGGGWHIASVDIVIVTHELNIESKLSFALNVAEGIFP